MTSLDLISSDFLQCAFRSLQQMQYFIIFCPLYLLPASSIFRYSRAVGVSASVMLYEQRIVVLPCPRLIRLKISNAERKIILQMIQSVIAMELSLRHDYREFNAI